MKQSTLYIFLCIAGFIAPWLFLIGFFGLPQASIPLFFFSIFVNPVASAVAADLVVSAIVFLVFVFPEGQRLGLKNIWLVVPATLLVGLSFGFPLFLYLRAKKLEQALYPGIPLEDKATIRKKIGIATKTAGRRVPG